MGDLFPIFLYSDNGKRFDNNWGLLLCAFPFSLYNIEKYSLIKNCHGLASSAGLMLPRLVSPGVANGTFILLLAARPLLYLDARENLVVCFLISSVFCPCLVCFLLGSSMFSPLARSNGAANDVPSCLRLPKQIKYLCHSIVGRYPSTAFPRATSSTRVLSCIIGVIQEWS